MLNVSEMDAVQCCRRGPYNKNSRSTLWRRHKEHSEQLDNCSCEYHNSSTCECEWHKLDDSSSSCSCEFHCYDSDSSSISVDSWLSNFSSGSNESSSKVTDNILLDGNEVEEELTLQSAGEPTFHNDFPSTWVSTTACLEQQSLNANFSGVSDTSEEGLSNSSEQVPSVPSKEQLTALLLHENSHDSTLNLSDIKVCRLDHCRNEDSYSAGEGNSSSSSDYEPSSDDEVSNGESDGRESFDGDGDGDPEGDDPGDDPAGDGEEQDVNISNLNEIVDENNFSLNHPSLNRVLQAADGRTAKEVLAMNLTLAVKQNLNYVTLVELCRMSNVTNAFKALPSTKKQLWAVLQKKSAGIVKHAYCEDCYSVLGVVNNLPPVVECNNEQCEYNIPRRNVKYFITLSLRKQLKNLLSIPGIRQHLQFKNNRRKLNPDALEDVLDGQGYKALEDKEDGLQDFDLSCELNTDGFSTSKSSNSQGWAILLRINELPPALRQRLTLLVGLVIGDGEPDMTMLFGPLVNEMNDISRNGVQWEEDGQNFISRLFPTCLCLDARARAILLNLNIYSGHYSCPFCLHPGVKLAGSMRFPVPGTELVIERRGVEHVVVIPDTPLRTDAGVRIDMGRANAIHKVHGFHGASVLATLTNFDFGIGCSTDDLHPIFLGVTKFITNLIINEAENTEELLAQIDGRLLNILTPTLISRKPRSISKRGKYKGTEWRNWLLYFGVLCMSNLIPNASMRLFSLLSKAVFLLSQDSVTNNDIDVAQECLQRFVNGFQEKYGPEKMRFNIHIMMHLAEAVRSWGPLHLHSTFPFESWNGRLRKNISSPHGAADQIVDRYLLESLVHKLPFDQELDEEVREELKSITSNYVMDNPLKIGEVYFFGKSAHPRPPTDDEMLVLNDEGLHCDLLTEYYQCRKSKMLLHSARHYALADRTSKSNNSVIFTADNQFFIVQQIVVFQQDEEQKCGLFCHLLEVGNALHGASHIREVNNEVNNIQWVSFDNVRKLAIKMQLRNNAYIVPMSNMGEID